MRKFIPAVLVVVTTVLLLGFQNCGQQDRPSDAPVRSMIKSIED